MNSKILLFCLALYGGSLAAAATGGSVTTVNLSGKFGDQSSVRIAFDKIVAAGCFGESFIVNLSNNELKDGSLVFDESLVSDMNGVDLSDNSFTKLPCSLSPFKNITSLRISNNSLEGILDLRAFPHLKRLDFQDNDIRGVLLADGVALTELLTAFNEQLLGLYGVIDQNRDSLLFVSWTNITERDLKTDDYWNLVNSINAGRRASQTTELMVRKADSSRAKRRPRSGSVASGTSSQFEQMSVATNQSTETHDRHGYQKSVTSDHIRGKMEAQRAEGQLIHSPLKGSTDPLSAHRHAKSASVVDSTQAKQAKKDAEREAKVKAAMMEKISLAGSVSDGGSVSNDPTPSRWTPGQIAAAVLGTIAAGGAVALVVAVQRDPRGAKGVVASLKGILFGAARRTASA